MKDSLREPRMRASRIAQTQSSLPPPPPPPSGPLVSGPTAIGVYIDRSKMRTSQPETTSHSQSDIPFSDKSPLGNSSLGSPDSDDPLLRNNAQTSQYAQSQVSRGPQNREPVRKYHGMSGHGLSFAIALVAGMDFLLFGYDQGVMGGLLTLPSFERQFPQITWYGLTGHARSTRSTYQGITLGIFNLGCFSGSLLTIWIGDLFGRKKTILMGTVIMIIGAIIQATSFSWAQLLVGRYVTGFGNGLNTSTIPTWQSETSKSHRRGQLVMIGGAMITAGIMISYWISYGFSFIDGGNSSVSWRFPIAFQIVFSIAVIVLILGLPESPRWLILQGRELAALEVLSALNERSTDDPYVQNEFTAIKDTILEMSKGSFVDMFTMDKNRHFHRTALAFVAQVFQQISGINLITYYAAAIFQQSLGYSPATSRLLAACSGTEYFLASWIAVMVIEKLGRRKLMMFGAVGQSICMIVLAACTAYVGRHRGAGIAATVFLFLFNTVFAIGWLGIGWLYPAEIVPLRIRASANALSCASNWIFNFMVVMITPVAFANITYRTYIIFAVINAFIAPAIYFFFPETAYRSLEEMDIIFHKSPGTLDAVSVAQDTPHRYGKNGEMLVPYDEGEDGVYGRDSGQWRHAREKEMDEGSPRESRAA